MWELEGESVVDIEREERRAAAQHDRRDLRRIGGMWFEADRVPHEADCE